MEQQYITRLAEAYKRGYEKRYVDSTGSPTKIALCKEMAKEEGCYEGCYPFASDKVRRAFLSGQDALESMLGKLVLPEPREARKVEWIGV